MAWLSSPPDPIVESVSYGTSKLFSVGPNYAEMFEWKITDRVEVYRGMTKEAAELLAETKSGITGHHAVARRANEAGGWEVRDEIHNVEFVGSTQYDPDASSSSSS